MATRDAPLLRLALVRVYHFPGAEENVTVARPRGENPHRDVVPQKVRRIPDDSPVMYLAWTVRVHLARWGAKAFSDLQVEHPRLEGLQDRLRQGAAKWVCPLDPGLVQELQGAPVELPDAQGRVLLRQASRLQAPA